MAQYSDYDDLFRAAMKGHDPYPYQCDVASGTHLPALIDVPPGLGKTAAVIVGWLWFRLFHPSAEVRDSTPRRLIVTLPMRTLTRQTYTVVRSILDELQLDVGLGLLTGESGDRKTRPWRLEPHRNVILIGITDIVTSGAMTRSYGSSRSCFPIDAGLIWNDSHIVLDEVQLMPNAAATLRQISAFQARHGANRFGLTCMSATITKGLLSTVDNQFPSADETVRIAEGDQPESLLRRLHSARTIVRLNADTRNAKDFAAELLRIHKPGTLTLVVINTVDRATEIYVKATALASASGPMITLLHSRFRPCERDTYIDRIGTDPRDDILIATQVIEAGIDLDAATLITEAAPWSSLVQRSGRCNRAGQHTDATVYWVVPPSAAPYGEDDVDATVAALTAVDGESVTNAELLATSADEAIPLVPVLRESDFEALFDTAPDLSGNDFDVSPYIRDSDDMDAQLAWVDLESAPPTSDTEIPDPQFRCRVPLRRVLEVATRTTKRKTIWSYAHSERKWVQISKIRPPRPGEILLVDKSTGLYDPRKGFDPKSDKPVTIPESDETSSREYRLIDSAVTSDSSDADGGSIDHPQWLSLDQHLAETRAQARAVVDDLPLESALKDDVVLSAYLHDLGKEIGRAHV